MSGKPTVISTFAGCGGSSLGYQMAGFQELLAIEWEDNAAKTLQANFPGLLVWQRDIGGVTAAEIMTACGLAVGELDVFDGSPPCQGFSLSGKREVSDDRNSLYKDYLRLVQELQPKTIVMENVAGMVVGKMKGMFKEIFTSIEQSGYRVSCRRMNAMYHGVPQARERLIFIGVRADLEKAPTHPKPKTAPMPVCKAIADLEMDTAEAFAAVPKYIRPYLLKMREGETASKYSGGTKYYSHARNWAIKPSRTIMKTPVLYHYKESRLHTKEELKRLASFPDDFVLIGNLVDAYNRIGNSVPPKLMEAIAENIKADILCC